MGNTDTKIARRISWIAASLAILVSISLPLVYFSVSREHLAGSLEKEAEIKAEFTSQLISSTPDMWRFQAHTHELLRRQSKGEDSHLYRVIDTENRVITQNSVKLEWPILTRTEDLFDSGSIVGRVELSRSLRPLLVKTGLMALLGGMIGLAVFVTLQVLPIRALLRAWQSLSQSQARFQGILDTANDAIISVDEKQQILLFNKRAERIFGYQTQEIFGKSLNVLFPARVAQIYKGAAEQSETEYFPYRQIGEQQERLGLRKSGEEFPIEISISKLEVEDKPITTIIVRDITERKRAEAIARYTQEELRRSNVELEQFAHVASHDLQEPLRMVTSYVQLLEKRYKDKLGPDAHEFIAYAVDGVSQMQHLINGLLAYARAGTRGKDLKPTDCETILGRALANLQKAIEASGATVTHDPLPTVMADEAQLVALFQNLVGNAIKFRGDKTPEVHVAAVREDDTWLFSARDNGIGINPAHAERIFTVFQRLHARGEYPGTGIGLAICKRVVERHGGRIWVESEPQKGSAFYFTIPTKVR